jgi:mono/diheme cytochrome c family protein
MLSRAVLTWAMRGCCAILLLGAVPAMAGEPPWTAPAAERGIKNPLPPAAGMQEGKKVFEANCVVCHGPGGKGDGPVGAALNPKPGDLTSKAVQAQSDGELFWKISTGRGAMPSWQTLPQKDRWSLVQFIRNLSGKR